MFPWSRAEPTNDVAALAPPARGQEGANEIIPTSLTTRTEEAGSQSDTILTPGPPPWPRLVPPDTFSFGPRGDRSCWVLPWLRPGEKPRKTLRKRGGGGFTSTGRGSDAPSVPQVKKENRAMGDSCRVGRLELPSRSSGFSNSKLRRLRALRVQSVRSAFFFCSGGESEETLGRFLQSTALLQRVFT